MRNVTDQIVAALELATDEGRIIVTEICASVSILLLFAGCDVTNCYHENLYYYRTK